MGQIVGKVTVFLVLSVLSSSHRGARQKLLLLRVSRLLTALQHPAEREWGLKPESSLCSPRHAVDPHFGMQMHVLVFGFPVGAGLLWEWAASGTRSASFVLCLLETDNSAGVGVRAGAGWKFDAFNTSSSPSFQKGRRQRSTIGRWGVLRVWGVFLLHPGVQNAERYRSSPAEVAV